MICPSTIREAAACFQEAAPHTCLGGNVIRMLPRTGAVPGARAGRKYRVAIKSLGGLSERLCGAGEARPNTGSRAKMETKTLRPLQFKCFPCNKRLKSFFNIAPASPVPSAASPAERVAAESEKIPTIAQFSAAGRKRSGGGNF